MRLVGSLAGKNVYVSDHGPGDRRMPNDLREALKRHPTRDTLRQMGALAGQQWTAPEVDPVFGVATHAIPYLALLSIECAGDHEGTEMSAAEIVNLGAMFMDLVEPASAKLAEDERSGFEFVLRLARQFEFQADLRYHLPRIVLLLRDIWPRVEKARAISPTDDLVRLTGLPLEQLLVFGWAFSEEGVRGWFQPITDGSSFPWFSSEAQDVFLRWASADYETLRQLAAEAKAGLPLPDDSFDPYRFNPLVLFPIVRPDVQPNVPGGDVYLLPCQRFLFGRVHGGLYHLLADHHRGEGATNAFRSAFGHVFQEYVGELLREAVGPGKVLGERRYGLGRDVLDTVDWIIIEGDGCVLVEVKQASLSMPAKTLGDLVAAKADVKRNVVGAIRQLARTEGAIRGGQRELEDLANVRNFERLVVTYDAIPFANSYLRDLATEELGPGAPHVHACSISELEFLLGRCRVESLYQLLRRKRLGPDRQDDEDFTDWLAHEEKKDGIRNENPYLMAKSREIVGSWGVPQPPA